MDYENYPSIFDMVKGVDTKYVLNLTLMTDDFHKVKMICYKLNKSNKQIDRAEFYFDYKIYRTIMKITENVFMSGKSEYKFPGFFGGEDGKRRLTIIVNDGGKRGIKLLFNDEFSSKMKEGFTGKMIFSVDDLFNASRLFDTVNTVNNYELGNIKHILKKKVQGKGK